MKNIFNNLLFKVVCGILFGIALGYYAPEWLYRILITFQVLFSNFLKFAIPLILIGLIMPSISAYYHRNCVCFYAFLGFFYLLGGRISFSFAIAGGTIGLHCR